MQNIFQRFDAVGWAKGRASCKKYCHTEISKSLLLGTGLTGENRFVTVVQYREEDNKIHVA